MASVKKQTNYHFQYSILINNSRQKVWDYLINVSKWKEWDTELVESKLFENFSLRAKGMLKPKKGPRLKFYISELTPNKSYTFITKMPVGILKIKRTIEEKDNQIKFTDDIQFTGFLKRLFGLMIGRNFKSVLPDAMQNFKELVEKK